MCYIYMDLLAENGIKYVHMYVFSWLYKIETLQHCILIC